MCEVSSEGVEVSEVAAAKEEGKEVTAKKFVTKKELHELENKFYHHKNREEDKHVNIFWALAITISLGISVGILISIFIPGSILTEDKKLRAFLFEKYDNLTCVEWETEIEVSNESWCKITHIALPVFLPTLEEGIITRKPTDEWIVDCSETKPTTFPQICSQYCKTEQVQVGVEMVNECEQKSKYIYVWCMKDPTCLIITIDRNWTEWFELCDESPYEIEVPVYEEQRFGCQSGEDVREARGLIK